MKSKIHPLVFVLFLFATNSACTSTHIRVEQDLKNYDQHIEKLTKDFSATPENIDSIDWVKDKLNHMYEVDQYMRSYWYTPVKNNYSVEEKNQFNEGFLRRNNNLDSKNADDTKVILKKYEWFKISIFGQKADNQSWLLVQHADLDIEFQKNVLATLEKLYPSKTKPM